MTRSGNPNPSRATRIVSGKPPAPKPIDESLTWEIALERLRQEAREAILNKHRGLSKRLEIARQLQILEAAVAKPPEEDWEAAQAREIERIRAKRGGSDE